MIAISEEYPNYTPYCYANNNSIIYIDPDGNDWFYYSADGKSDPTWHWHEGSTYNTGVKDANGNEIVLQGVKPGYTYWSDKGEVILQDNGQWAFTGQKPIDPNCPTCDLNNGNIGWELFQVGAAQYSKLLKAGEIGLEISAYLLLGEVGAGGSLIRSASRVTARETLLNTVTNPRLKRMIDYLYRTGAKVGDGGTADIVRAEGTHIEKAKGALNGLKDILKKESLNETDKEIAKYLYNDLNDALKTTRTGK